MTKINKRLVAEIRYYDAQRYKCQWFWRSMASGFNQCSRWNQYTISTEYIVYDCRRLYIPCYKSERVVVPASHIVRNSKACIDSRISLNCSSNLLSHRRGAFVSFLAKGKCLSNLCCNDFVLLVKIIRAYLVSIDLVYGYTFRHVSFLMRSSRNVISSRG